MLEGLLIGLAIKALRKLVAKHAPNDEVGKLLDGLVLEVLGKLIHTIKNPSPETLAVGKVWQKIMATPREEGGEPDPLKAFKLARKQLGYE